MQVILNWKMGSEPRSSAHLSTLSHMTCIPRNTATCSRPYPFPLPGSFHPFELYSVNFGCTEEHWHSIARAAFFVDARASSSALRREISSQMSVERLRSALSTAYQRELHDAP